MADYIYTMESRFSPEQMRGVNLIQDLARAQELNLYLTGGAVRDLISGLPIRDLDFSIQGNPLKLQKELERAGAVIQGVDEDQKAVYVLLPGNVRAEISMTRSHVYEKPGKPPKVAPATIYEDLRRRDFTVNAMALSLNRDSRGLLLDPSNGMADIESKLLRILHNYAFYEDPARLIRATHYAARFHWPLEERTQIRYHTARENNYIEYISSRAIGLEIEQIAYEDDPLHILRALEKEDWLKVLSLHWTVAKADEPGLSKLVRMKQQMVEFGYAPDTAAAVLYFTTRRLADKEVAEIRKLIPRRSLVESWKRLDDSARELARKLTGKEAATPSRAWKLLSAARPETIIFTEITTRQQAVSHKIGNFFGKWREVKQKLPLPEMAELRVTPALPEYAKIAEEAFLLLLDGKLRSRNEILKFVKPYAPPPPPPPPPPKRGRTPKGEGGLRGRKPRKAVLPGGAAPVAAAAQKVPEPPPPPPAEPVAPPPPAPPPPDKGRKVREKKKERVEKEQEKAEKPQKKKSAEKSADKKARKEKPAKAKQAKSDKKARKEKPAKAKQAKSDKKARKEQPAKAKQARPDKKARKEQPAKAKPDKKARKEQTAKAKQAKPGKKATKGKKGKE
jgi:tRNA nucleotidyltransferase/poly(A) polymerase